MSLSPVYVTEVGLRNLDATQGSDNSFITQYDLVLETSPKYKSLNNPVGIYSVQWVHIDLNVYFWHHLYNCWIILL